MARAVAQLSLLGLLATTAAAAAAAAAAATTAPATTAAGPLKGFVYTSYSATGYLQPASDATVPELVASGIEVVELMYTYYVDNSVNATRIHTTQNSPTDAAVLHALATLKANGLRVALKPHIDCLDGIWRANIGTHFTNASQWADWFSNYTAFLAHATDLASQAGGVDFFNVGTELDGTHSHTDEWLAVIASVRAAVPASTKLWLGPNWGWNGLPGYQLVSPKIWAALDFLGVDMYAPIASHPDPTLEEAVAGWGPLVANLSAFSAQNGGKGFIFAEMGYASFKDAAVNAPACCSGPPDPATQAVLYEAFFQAVWGQPWMAGAFWWAWPENQPAGDPCGTGFDVWRKPAGLVLSKAYGGTVNGSALHKNNSPPSSSSSSSRSYSSALAGPQPLVLYSNGTRAWDDWSWNAAADWTSATDPYPGHAASASVSIPTLGSGAVALHFPGPGAAVDVSAYASLVLDVIVPNATNGAELYAWLCPCSDCNSCGVSLPAAPLVLYQVAQEGRPLSCSLAQDWASGAGAAAARVSVPLSALGLNGTFAQVARVQVGVQGGGSEWSPVDFSVDNVQFA